VANVIKDFNPEIIHVHNLFFIGSPSVLYAASKYKIPVVMTLHNYRLICANALLFRNGQVCELCVHKKFPVSGIRYKCYRDSASASALVTTITGIHKLMGTWKSKVDVFITPTEFVRSKLLNSSLKIPAKKMIIKSHFVPHHGSGREQRDDFFLFAGRIAKEKGVHILLQAFAAMPEQKIVIIGDGPEKNTLESEYKSYQNISFTGQVDKLQVREYMKKCKAFICPSIWYEVVPLTIIEAFSTGTPVIASRSGAMAESVSDGYNGLHFTTGDPNDLKAKINLFLKETETSKMFYKNAKQTYLQKYDPGVHYKAIIEIYKKVMVEK
jgi:glycosyltransferase involved in cell wall biosynthesis